VSTRTADAAAVATVVAVASDSTELPALTGAESESPTTSGVAMPSTAGGVPALSTTSGGGGGGDDGGDGGNVRGVWPTAASGATATPLTTPA